MVNLGRDLALEVVAEGVETPEQRDYLAARGVDYLQGYLIGRPMPLESLLSSLAGGRSACDSECSAGR